MANLKLTDDRKFLNIFIYKVHWSKQKQKKIISFDHLNILIQVNCYPLGSFRFCTIADITCWSKTCESLTIWKASENLGEDAFSMSWC
jgi:hypothetical protein